MFNIGERIRQARKEAGFTQKKLADLVEVHWNTVARWERNEVECRLDQMHRIAASTNKPLSWFFGEEAIDKSKVMVGVSGLKFRLAREKNDYSIKEVAVLLELPESTIEQLEKSSASLEMEYLHRMIFVLGYPVSWFFTDESNKEWCKSDRIYERWLDTGRASWKFQEHFYNMWEQEKMHPKLDFEDTKNWLKNSYKMWTSFFKKIDTSDREKSEYSDGDKKTLEYLKDLTNKLSQGVKSEIDFFLKVKRDREKYKSLEARNIHEIIEVGEKIEEE